MLLMGSFLENTVNTVEGGNGNGMLSIESYLENTANEKLEKGVRKETGNSA